MAGFEPILLIDGYIVKPLGVASVQRLLAGDIDAP
jgi:hypothetical protein